MPPQSRPDFRGGLAHSPAPQSQDYVAEHLAEEISIEALAELVELSPSHFSHVFKETTGMTPLQFVTRQRITRAQQMIRETSRSLIEIGLEVGYTSPSHFAQVFRRVVGVTPTEFRSSLEWRYVPFPQDRDRRRRIAREAAHCPVTWCRA